MATKKEAKQAWQVVMDFSMSHANKALTKEDITSLMQKAILTLNEYFTQEEKGDN